MLVATNAKKNVLSVLHSLITRNALSPDKSFYCLVSFQRYVNGCNFEILIRVTLEYIMSNYKVYDAIFIEHNSPDHITVNKTATPN